jgi:hypothetical protein
MGERRKKNLRYKESVPYIYFDRLDEGFIMEASNYQFEFIFMLLEELLCLLSETHSNYLRNTCIA